MVRFFLKKSFHDGWDNMLALAAFNGAAIAVAAAGIAIVARFDSAAARIVGSAVMIFGGAVWWSTAAHAFTPVADFKSLSMDAVRGALAAGIVPGLQFGAMMALSIACAAVALPFYASIGGLPGAFAAGLAFWLFASICLTLQWFLPVSARIGGGFVQSIRLSFLLFIDAPLFSTALFAYGAACVAISPLVAFMLPGPAAASLAACEATKLRFHRLRWLEESGGKAAGPTPWKELLAADIDEFGERSLKDLLFPWRH